MWQRFTERARKVVFYAQEEAQRFGEGFVSTEHLLLGLVREEDSSACRALQTMGIPLPRIQAEVEKQLSKGDGRPSQDMTLTPRAKRVIDLAYDEARNLNDDYIGTEHLLLGLIRESDGLAGRVLEKLGASLEGARKVVLAQEERQHRAQGEPITAPPVTTSVVARRVGATLTAIRLSECSTDFITLMLLTDPSGPLENAVERLNITPIRLETAIERAIIDADQRGSQKSSITDLFTAGSAVEAFRMIATDPTTYTFQALTQLGHTPETIEEAFGPQ